MSSRLSFNKTADGIVLRVKTKPNARKEDIVVSEDGTLTVAVSAPPHRGQANIRLIELLSSRLGISKTSVEIVRGHKAKEKYILIKCEDPSDLINALGAR